jgi:hypothetical protein
MSDSLDENMGLYLIVGLVISLVIFVFVIKAVTKRIRKRAQYELPNFKKLSVEEVALLWTKRAFVSTIAARVISNWALVIGLALMGIAYFLSNPIVGFPGLLIAVLIPIIGDIAFAKKPFPIDAFDNSFIQKVMKHWEDNKTAIVDKALLDLEVQEYLQRFPEFFQSMIIRNARSSQNSPISRREQALGGGVGN